MKKIRLIFFTCVIYFFVSTIQVVVVYKFVNPIVTPLMIIRVAEGVFGHENSVEIKKQWKPLNEMSHNIVCAVIASEDFNFFRHKGFNWNGIKRAIKYNEKHLGKKIRGGSSISQQTAKNVFLFPSRTWIRKGLEVYFTFLIEMLWSKERILEVYLNVIEVGDGIYGVESGAQVYFKLPVSKLTVIQAASLAAILPDPIHRSPIHPSKKLNRKIEEIQKLMIIIESRPSEFSLEFLDESTSLEKSSSTF